MIRLANMNDIDDIMQCIYDARAFLKASGLTQWNGPLGYPDIPTLVSDIENKIAYVCIRNNELCGVAIYAGVEPEYNSPLAKWLTSGDNYTTIHRIAVSNKYRGTGVGKELMLYAEEYAKGIGNSSIRIDTHPMNKAVLGLVTSLGYTNCGEIIYSRIPVEPTRVIFEKIIK